MNSTTHPYKNILKLHAYLQPHPRVLQGPGPPTKSFKAAFKSSYQSFPCEPEYWGRYSDAELVFLRRTACSHALYVHTASMEDPTVLSMCEGTALREASEII